MTNTLPAPLTPADCDLRDFQFLPIDVVRLRDSDMAATPNAEVFRAAVLCWCVAFHQVPAASLPDDDGAIARLIGMGRNSGEAFAVLRAAGALRGFVKCSDGRLYHTVVAEKAMTAWEAKSVQRNRTAAAREAYLAKHPPVSKGKAVTPSATRPVTTPVTQPVTASKLSEGKGSKGTGRKKEAPTLRADLLPEASLPIQIPEWIPVEPWEAFRAMRDKAKKPMSDYAIKLMIGKLLRLKLAGEDIGACLDQSTLSVWDKVYPVKTEGNSFGKSPASNSFGSTLSRVVEERAASRAAGQRGSGDAGPPDDGLEDILGGGYPQLRLAHNNPRN